MNLNEMLELDSRYKKEINKKFVGKMEMVKISYQEGMIAEDTYNKYMIIAGICEAGENWFDPTKGSTSQPVYLKPEEKPTVIGTIPGTDSYVADAAQKTAETATQVGAPIKLMKPLIFANPETAEEVKSAVAQAAKKTSILTPDSMQPIENDLGTAGPLSGVGRFFANAIGKVIPLTPEQKMSIIAHPQSFFTNLQTIFKGKGLTKYLPGGHDGMIMQGFNKLQGLPAWGQFASMFGAGILGIGVLKLAGKLIGKIRSWWKNRNAPKQASGLANQASESTIGSAISLFNKMDKNERRAHKFFLFESLKQHYHFKDAVKIYSIIIGEDMLVEAVEFYAKG